MLTHAAAPNERFALTNQDTKMKVFAGIALFLFAALAASSDTEYIFGAVGAPACFSCLEEVVSAGPGSWKSQEFAEYLCIGRGARAISSCIITCSDSSGDELDIAYASTQSTMVVAQFFDYWYVFSFGVTGGLPANLSKC